MAACIYLCLYQGRDLYVRLKSVTPRLQIPLNLHATRINNYLDSRQFKNSMLAHYILWNTANMAETQARQTNGSTILSPNNEPEHSVVYGN